MRNPTAAGCDGRAVGRASVRCPVVFAIMIVTIFSGRIDGREVHGTGKPVARFALGVRELRGIVREREMPQQAPDKFGFPEGAKHADAVGVGAAAFLRDPEKLIACALGHLSSMK